MYTGTMIEELVGMVMRAEDRARDEEMIEPPQVEIYTPHYAFEPVAQPTLIGVA